MSSLFRNILFFELLLSLTVTTLSANSADDKASIFFLFQFLKKGNEVRLAT